MQARLLSKFAVSLLLAAAAHGQSYLPLEVGNQWVYRVTGTPVREPIVTTIVASEVAGGRTYFRLRQPSGERLLRYDAEGSLLEYDQRTSSEQVSYRFNSAPVKYSGPLGAFENAIETTASDGATEIFVPRIGLVRRSSGGVTHELVYAHSGRLEYRAGAGLAFTLGLDRLKYPANYSSPIVARIALQNDGAESVELEYLSGQRFEIMIRDSQDRVVYTWSADKIFTQEVRRETLRPGESRDYAALVGRLVGLPTPGGPSRLDLAPGKYVVEAWLTTSPKQYSGRVGFELGP